MNICIKAENRFHSGAKRYADYLESTEGRLRADLTFANVEEFLPAQCESVLDLGCGTGATAVRLANVGMRVTAFDSSAAMLDLAQQTITAAGVSANVTLKCGDAAQLADLFPQKSFDLILCHNVLEYVDSLDQVLHHVACLLRNSSAVLSILVRNQAGEALKAALRAGDLVASEQSLESEWGRESLYGGSVRLFTPDGLAAMLQRVSLHIAVRRGVRVFSDYLPENISMSGEYDSVFSLERKFGQRQEFFGVARYLHCLAHRAGDASETSR